MWFEIWYADIQIYSDELVQGRLVGFDQVSNMVLDDTKETLYIEGAIILERSLGNQLVIRGTAVESIMLNE